MKKVQNFLICGLTGWCMEILFTSAGSIYKKDYRLTGHTSLWMFPIYGMASAIGPVSRQLGHIHPLIRGTVYSAGIFTGEYVSGHFLRKIHACPWDYSAARLNVNGLIRLDFAPLWIAAGLIFERILADKKLT